MGTTFERQGRWAEVGSRSRGQGNFGIKAIGYYVIVTEAQIKTRT